MGIATRLADLAGAAMLTTTELVDVERIDELFLLVTLQSPSFGSSTWLPGSKVDRATLLDHVHRLAARTPGPYRLIVTEDAATVHAARRESRGWTAAPSTVTGKAYWAAGLGRTGLD